jgi:hypothetical protein
MMNSIRPKWLQATFAGLFVNPARKHIHWCHSGLDPESSAVLDFPLSRE